LKAMERTKIILDTDIADDIDDAYALYYALCSSELELLGVTTVYKNVHQRSLIAKKELALAGFAAIPVIAGSDAPLVESVQPFSYEKKNGRTINLLSYEPSLEKYRYEKGEAVDFILNVAARYPNEVTVVGIGPLTNLAKAYQKDPQRFLLLKKAVLMNGNPHGGKEWNVMVDPEAASLVYHSGIPIDSVGVDITMQATLSPDELATLEGFEEPALKYLTIMMEDWRKANRRSPILHDCLPIDSLISSHLVFEGYQVDVPLLGALRGSLEVQKDSQSPIRFATSFDRTGFIDGLLRKLSQVHGRKD